MHIKRHVLSGIIAGVLVLAWASPVFAWRSVLGSTHHAISVASIKAMDAGQYQDIASFKDEIIAESSTEVHRKMDDNGGIPKDWWDGTEDYTGGGVMQNYFKLNFPEAYKGLGKMIHLVQDQGVPAHAANIRHGYTGGLHMATDPFEEYDADGNAPDIKRTVSSHHAPYEYYQMLQDDTRRHLSDWTDPKTGEPYWRPVLGVAPLGQDATFGPRGSYGAPYVYDVKTMVTDGNGNVSTEIVSTTDRPDIRKDRLAATADYTMAALESASLRLPPMISDFHVVNEYPVSVSRPAMISFDLMDNRSKTLVYDIRVCAAECEVITSGEAQLSPKDGMMSANIVYQWDTVLNGTPYKSGTYRLFVDATDEDGNTIPEAVMKDDITTNDNRAFIVIQQQ